MELHMNDFNPSALLESTGDMLRKEFNKLRREFPKIKEAKYPLFIVTHVQWLDIIKDILINISKPDELINIVKIELDDRTLMRTGVNGVRSDGTVIQYVRLPVESLLNILYFNLNKYDALVKYLKMSLRHEVGHLLSNEVIVGRHADDIMSAAQELTDLSNETRKEMELMYEDYKDSPTDEIWFKRYYSTPLEAMANNMVGLTYKDFYNSYLGLNCI